MARNRDPETREQWQDAVDAAEALLHFDSARQYGLIVGGPQVNVERCAELLRRGAELGIYPAPDAVERLARAAVGGGGDDCPD